MRAFSCPQHTIPFGGFWRYFATKCPKQPPFCLEFVWNSQILTSFHTQKRHFLRPQLSSFAPNVRHARPPEFAAAKFLIFFEV